MADRPANTTALATGLDTGEGRVPIWLRPERAAKGPAPSRNRRQVAEAAVALADADGIGAATIRAVAARLGIGAASLYRYVDSKEELLDLMIDWVEGEDGPPPRTTGDWRSDLSALAHRVRALILRHPWMASVTAVRPRLGPNSLAWAEYGLEAMSSLDLDPDELLVASEVLHAYVRGFAASELATLQALQRAQLTDEEWTRDLAPYVNAVLESGRYPQFARIVRDASLPHADNRQELLFTSGLQSVLDGLLAHSGAPRTAP